MDPEELSANEVEFEDEDDDLTSSDDDEPIDEDEDSSSSDSTTSDEEDSEMNGFNANKLSDEEYEKQLKVLEDSIQANKFQYQSYVDIIKLAKENNDFSKLKEYREQMSDCFPLAEHLWLDWLKDEQKLIESDSDRLRVKQLFEKAIQDYLSVDLWLEYIQFSIGGMAEPNGTENVRSIGERAISFAGLHVTKGHILWEGYREFENALLTGFQQTYAGTVQSEEKTKLINEQINRIINLFKRELSICLLACSSTFKEFQEFDENQITEDVKKTNEKSVEKLKQIEPFELALKNAISDSAKRLTEYNVYLDFELKLVSDLEKNKIKQNNKANETFADELRNDLVYHRKRLKCLFERAIADDSNCLDVNLWLKYINYLNEEEGFVESNESQRVHNISVAKRSIRNCPWSSKLWINYTFLLERTNSSMETIKTVFNEAMNAGLQTSDDYLQIWHAYLDFLRRLYIKSEETDKTAQIEELRETFQKAINQLFDFFKHQGDPTFSLEKYWSNCEAKYFKSMEQCRKIYNEMIIAKSDHCKYSPIWIEFYNLETQFGDEKHQRKLLNRALNEVVSSDDKEIIYDLLLKFEKLNGNVQQYSNVYFKYEQFKSEQEKFRLETKKKFEPKKEQTQKQKPQISAKKEPTNRQAEKAKSEPSNNLKRKKSEPDSNEIKQSESKKQLVSLKDKDGFAIPNIPTLIAATTNALATAVQNDKPIEKKTTEISSSSSTENYKKFSNLTVFISNLSFDVDETKLKAIFEKQPGFKEVRLIKHWSGKSKGYGYVDFDSVENATNALKLDRSLIDGRPVFVSKNEDKTVDLGPQNKLKYAANLEKNKLFVSGLPFTSTNKDLEEIFKNFGKLKEVRIVTYKNGKSKGLAYVEFEDEQSAKKALLQTDQMLIGEQTIAVAISNPPKRKLTERELIGFQNEENKEKIKTSLGSGKFTSGVAPAPRTTAATASFVPRSQMIGRKTRIDFKK